jgi:ketosteroid isomerase-like protein
VSAQLDQAAFRQLVQRLAAAWEQQDTETAVGCFTSDADYLEPPDVQLFRGSDELRAYFGALTPGTTMTLRHVWFDEPRQVGAAEYSFGGAGQPTAVHGVAVLEIRDGLISRWREYQQRGPAGFDEFLSSEGKEWQWSIRNYP